MPAGNPVHKPTEVPRWADDASSVVAPVPTIGAVVEPTEGKKTSGFAPGEKPPAQFFGWFWYWSYWWLLYLADLTNLNFITGTNNPGPWTGTHRFVGGSGTPTITIVNGGTSGQAGLDSTGDGGATLTNPGPGLIGRGGTPAAGGLGADGVQGYGSGASGRGGYFVGGTTTTSGGAGVEAHGGASANGADLYGGVIPSGGGHPGMGFTATGGSGGTGGDGGYVQGDSGGASNTNGVTLIGYGTGSGLIGISMGSGPAVQGGSLGTGLGGYFADSPGAAALLVSATHAHYAAKFQSTGNALTVYVTNSTTSFAAMEIDAAGDGLVLNAAAAGFSGLIVSANGRLEKAIKVTNGVITWTGSLPDKTEVPPNRSMGPLNGVFAWGSCPTVTGSRYSAWQLIDGNLNAGFSYNSGTKTITFSWGNPLLNDVDGNAWPNVHISTTFGHLHTITAQTSTSVSFQLTTTPNGTAIDATALGQTIMVSVVGRPN